MLAEECEEESSMKLIRPSIAAIVLPIVLLFSMLISVCPVLAEGDGSGGGQDVPLGLASSSPVDGAQNVALDTRIKLIFNKNVVNMTVKENNLRCFSLYAGNVAVPIEVQMADDQINPELKREVNLIPRQVLQPGTDYSVVISQALQAKNGVVMGKDVKIRFKTAAAEKSVPPAPAGEEKKPAEPPAPLNPGSTPEPEPKAVLDSDNNDTVPAEKDESEIKPESLERTQTDSMEKKSPTKTDDASENAAWIWPVSIALVIVLGAGYGYFRKRS